MNLASGAGARPCCVGTLFVCLALAIKGLDAIVPGPPSLVIAGGLTYAVEEFVPGGTAGTAGWLGTALTLGMVVHSLGDAVTETGAPLLWPLRIRQRRWYPVGSPRPLRFRTGGAVEAWLVAPVLTVAVFLLAAFAVPGVAPLLLDLRAEAERLLAGALNLAADGCGLGDGPAGVGLSLPPRPVVGVLHPGAMGAALGSALKPVAGAVIWAAAGRSQSTSKRAELADLVGVPDIAALARRADVIVSICPPHAARDVAGEVAAALTGDPRRPLYVDANAVSPATVRGIGERAGAGPGGRRRDDRPARVGGGPHGAVALRARRPGWWRSCSRGSPFEAQVLGPRLGAASALKACYAVQSKALPAAWVAIADAAPRTGCTTRCGASWPATPSTWTPC